MVAGQVVAVVALLHLRLGNEVRDFLVHVKLFRRNSTLPRAELVSGERASVDHGVNFREFLVESGGGFRLESGEDSQQVLEILEAVLLRLLRLVNRGKLVDLRLNTLLAPGERVVLGLGEYQGLVRPAHRHELADKWHL